jgi:trigger factor
VEGCKRILEFSVPLEEVQSETGRVVGDIQKRARLQGFRPGKAPASLIRKYYAADVRKQVLENLIPRHLDKRLKEDNLNIVSQPDITDVHFHEGEPLTFRAAFEVAPEIDLKEYRGLSVPYHDPEITEEDIDRRVAEMREQKADYANVDPRPLEDGDFAVLALESLNLPAGEAVKNDEMMLEIGGKDTFEAFTEALRGMAPGDEADIEVSYPEDYAQRRLAGKTVKFHAAVKGVRRKELPEVDDNFAQDLGDYRNLAELRDAVRKSLFAQRQYDAQQEAKNRLIDQLVDLHEFPVPEVYIDRQIESRLEQTLRGLAGEGVDPRKLNLDWEKIREGQKDRAVREVKGSLLLGKISEREAIHATREEVDREIERIARQRREPIAAVRASLEKDGTASRIASHIQTEKTLNFLFEHATKTAE